MTTPSDDFNHFNPFLFGDLDTATSAGNSLNFKEQKHQDYRGHYFVQITGDEMVVNHKIKKNAFFGSKTIASTEVRIKLSEAEKKTLADLQGKDDTDERSTARNEKANLIKSAYQRHIITQISSKGPDDLRNLSTSILFHRDSGNLLSEGESAFLEACKKNPENAKAIFENLKSDPVKKLGKPILDSLKRRLLLLKDENGNTPLHLAVLSGDSTLVAFLIDEMKTLKLDDHLNAFNNANNTPLSLAIFKQDGPMIVELRLAMPNKHFDPSFRLKALELGVNLSEPLTPQTIEFYRSHPTLPQQPDREQQKRKSIDSLKTLPSPDQPLRRRLSLPERLSLLLSRESPSSSRRQAFLHQLYEECGGNIPEQMAKELFDEVDDSVRLQSMSEKDSEGNTILQRLAKSDSGVLNLLKYAPAGALLLPDAAGKTLFENVSPERLQQLLPHMNPFVVEEIKKLSSPVKTLIETIPQRIQEAVDEKIRQAEATIVETLINNIETKQTLDAELLNLHKDVISTHFLSKIANFLSSKEGNPITRWKGVAGLLENLPPLITAELASKTIDDYGTTLLHAAVKNKDANAIALLLNEKDAKKLLFEMNNAKGLPPIAYASPEILAALFPAHISEEDVKAWLATETGKTTLNNMAKAYSASPPSSLVRLTTDALFKYADKDAVLTTIRSLNPRLSAPSGNIVRSIIKALSDEVRNSDSFKSAIVEGEYTIENYINQRKT